MKKSIQLSIAKPCTENFESFKKTPSGGYCQSCKKEVIDFTQMTDKQLIHYFSTTKGSTCGRFKKDQLKTYQRINQNDMKKFLPRTIGIAGFSLLALCAIPELSAQDTDVALAQEKTPKEVYKNAPSEDLATQKSHTVKGVVLDEEGLGLPGVNVVLKGTALGTQTDFEGKFEFPQALEERDVLIFSYIGYETKTYKVKAGTSDVKDITIQFKASDVTLLGAVTVGGVHKSKRNIFQKIGDLFR